MKYKIFCIMIFPFILCTSCLYSRSTVSSMPIRAGIKIYDGNAIVRIDGKIHENLHIWNIFHESQSDRLDDNLFARAGTVTKSETRVMVTGEEYRFSVLPTETVTINIVSADYNDVQLIVFRHGRKERHKISGMNRLGFTTGIHNR